MWVFFKILFARRRGFDMHVNSKVLLSALTKYTRDYGETFVCIQDFVTKVATQIVVCRASEKKRRQVYRGEVGGLLPFEIRGMDDPIPFIDFSPTGGLDSVYSFERSDIDRKYPYPIVLNSFVIMLS